MDDADSDVRRQTKEEFDKVSETSEQRAEREAYEKACHEEQMELERLERVR